MKRKATYIPSVLIVGAAILATGKTEYFFEGLVCRILAFTMVVIAFELRDIREGEK